MTGREDPRLTRTFEEANEIQLFGMARGAGLGAILILPLGVAVGVFGAWLDGPASSDDLVIAALLTAVVTVIGAFVGVFWVGQREAMKDWPEECRQCVWKEWHWGIRSALLLGAPVACLLGWLTWQSEGSWCLSLVAGLEVCLFNAGIGLAVGYGRGERAARRSLERAALPSAESAEQRPDRNRTLVDTNLTVVDGIERDEANSLNRAASAGGMHEASGLVRPPETGWHSRPEVRRAAGDGREGKN